MESAKIKSKHERATHEQLQRFVAFYRANPEMGTGKNCPKSPQHMQGLWMQVSDELNALRGPTRTAAKWKETLGVWKSQLRTRARRLKMNQRLTGGGPACKQMTEFEERALATFGLAAVTGVGVENFGLISPQSEEPSVERPTSSIACGLPSPARSPSYAPSPSHAPPLSPAQSPTAAHLSSSGPSPSAAPLLSPAPSPSVAPLSSPAPTTFSSETDNDTVLDLGSGRPSRGERNKLINALIANIAKRNTLEEQRQRRAEEEREEHRESMQAIQKLTSCVAELIQTLKQK